MIVTRKLLKTFIGENGLEMEKWEITTNSGKKHILVQAVPVENSSDDDDFLLILKQIEQKINTDVENWKEEGREEIRKIVREAVELPEVAQEARKKLEDEGVIPKKEASKDV